LNFQHFGQSCDKKANGGQRWKKQRQGFYGGVYEAVATQKVAPPEPKDLMKTVQTIWGRPSPTMNRIVF